MVRRYVLNIKYPKKIRNTELYEKTKITKWSEIIARRRLVWLGHACRLDENTPAKIALRYSIEEYKKKKGRPKLTWIKQVEDQLKQININIEEAFELAKDKIEWRKTVNLWSQNVARATITV